MSIVPGLISVTFRQLAVEDIASLAASCGLAGIEWGADIHVPPGDVDAAERARSACEDNGLSVMSYGSYWHAGDDADDELLVILDTAVDLGAEVVRVWAGRSGSARADAWQRAVVTNALVAAGAAAAERDLRVAVEFHSGTLTDTGSSAAGLFESIGSDHVRSHWQPPVGILESDAMAGLASVARWLEAVHVFSWAADGSRLPLADRAGLWRHVLAFVNRLPGTHPAMLEFVADDDPERLREDAATLLGWLSSVADGPGDT